LVFLSVIFKLRLSAFDIFLFSNCD
jgi:hypothetical protein